MSAAEAFYLPVRPGVFRSTEHTVGPWTASDQHAGPPSALLVRAMEQVLPASGGQLARITIDILGAVPVAEVEVTAEVVRSGRSVQLAAAELRATNGTGDPDRAGTPSSTSNGRGDGNGGRVLARASAWWHRAGETSALVTPTMPPPPRPPANARPGTSTSTGARPDTSANTGTSPVLGAGTGTGTGAEDGIGAGAGAGYGIGAGNATVTEDAAGAGEGADAGPGEPGAEAGALWTSGYLAAMEWRWVEGHFMRRGPATVWTRMRYPLVPGEVPSAAQRVMVTADSGNGISNELDMASWLFVNTELTVHLVRPAVGEWVGMAARTDLGASGTGLATTRLFDEEGEVGCGAQALVVRPRQ